MHLTSPPVREPRVTYDMLNNKTGTAERHSTSSVENSSTRIVHAKRLKEDSFKP